MLDARSLLESHNAPPKDKTAGAGPSSSLTDVEGVKKKQGRPTKYESKRPEGMKRELFNLLTPAESKEITSMLPLQNKQYRNPKVQMGKRPVRKYRWVPFVNEARTDGLRLYHWQREDRIAAAQPYPFAAMNKVIKIPTYTEEEYKEHLESSKWSKEETDILFDICRRFDRRWPVVVDRYETARQAYNSEEKKKSFDKRSMEDLKERFYAVSMELNQLHGEGDQSVVYDAEHEKRRKEQLKKQWDRSEAEIEEEEALRNELKKIEARRKERERKAQDLQKLINMEQEVPSPGGSLSPAPGKKKFMRTKMSSTNQVTSSLPISLEMTSSTLRYSEFRSAGTHLRSQEMKLPTNIGQKKLKNIETVIEKLKLDVNPMGAEEIVTAYNEFRSNVVLLQELKQSLLAAEYELERERTRLMHQGVTPFEMEPRMQVSSLPVGGLPPSTAGIPGAPTSLRRITSYIDATAPTNPLNTRKRKMVLPGSPLTNPKKLRKS